MTVPVHLAAPPDSLPSSCNLVIVGAGLAGLELANSLERSGALDAVVLEAGPCRDLRHVNVAHSPATALRRWLVPETDDCFRQPWTSLSPPHYTGSSGVRQRFGGRSLYWYGVSLPIERWALGEPWWPPEVTADLCDSWQGGASLYKQIEQELGSWKRSGLQSSLTDNESVATIGGYSLRPTPRAIKPSSAGDDRWYAYSPLDHWRDPENGAVRRDPNCVRFYEELGVVNIIVRDSTVRGVVVRRMGSGELVEVHADAVVLAAGTLENARLALQALSEVQALEGEPMLSGLMDHIVQGVFVRLGKEHSGRLRSFLSAGSYFAPCSDARSNLFLDLQELPGGETLVDLQLTGEQMPSPLSYVTCTEKEQFPWKVSVSTALSLEDPRGDWGPAEYIAGCLEFPGAGDQSSN